MAVAYYRAEVVGAYSDGSTASLGWAIQMQNVASRAAFTKAIRDTISAYLNDPDNLAAGLVSVSVNVVAI